MERWCPPYQAGDEAARRAWRYSKSGPTAFIVEAPDMVQAQERFHRSDLRRNKTRSALELAKIVEQQNMTLFEFVTDHYAICNNRRRRLAAAENDVRPPQISAEMT